MKRNLLLLAILLFSFSEVFGRSPACPELVQGACPEPVEGGGLYATIFFPLRPLALSLPAGRQAWSKGKRIFAAIPNAKALLGFQNIAFINNNLTKIELRLFVQEPFSPSGRDAEGREGIRLCQLTNLIKKYQSS